MQDADLFMELAGIAGVFVGFGALIVVRSGGASDPFEVAYMRGVVSVGRRVDGAGLAPRPGWHRRDPDAHPPWARSGLELVPDDPARRARRRMGRWGQPRGWLIRIWFPAGSRKAQSRTP